MRWFRRAAILLGALAALGAVGAAAFAVSPEVRFALVNAPSLWFSGRIARDIPFGSHGRRLDVYAPADAADAPVVVFFYGGGWRRGERAQYRFIGMTLAARGYVVAIPDYRKHPEVRFPAFVEDGAQAVAWATREIGAYGGDPARINLLGHSAGAHLATLLASDGRHLAAVDMAPADVAAVAGLAGPYHFTPRARHLVQIFGPPERFPEMQVSRFIDGDEPPMLLAYGLADRVVGPQNLARMEAAIEAAGGCAQVIRYPETDHVAIVSAFTWLFRDARPMVEDVTRFFDAPRATCWE